MLLAQDTVLLFTLLTDSDRPFSFVLPGELIPHSGEQEKWTKLSQEEIRVHMLSSFFQISHTSIIHERSWQICSVSSKCQT